MKSIRKLISIGIVTLILICGTNSTFAKSQQDTPNITYTIGDDLIYQKTTTYEFKDSNKTLKYELEVDNDLEGELVSYSTVEVYVEEKIDHSTNSVISSRLLTNSEVEALKTGIGLRGGGSTGKGKLTVSMWVTDLGGGKYKAKADTDWSGYAFLNSSHSPARGEDVIGITWGGEFKATSKSISGKDNMNGYLGSRPYSLADSDAYKGYAWWFKEDLGIVYDQPMFVANTDASVTIERTHPSNYQGKESTIKLTYIHTYGSVSGGVSINGSGVPIVSLSGANKQWPLEVNCSGITY